MTSLTSNIIVLIVCIAFYILESEKAYEAVLIKHEYQIFTNKQVSIIARGGAVFGCATFIASSYVGYPVFIAFGILALLIEIGVRVLIQKYHRQPIR
ncbi:hypothetical protein CCB80_14800 [Armatimonadetes bacterium Uphvl-Ar1]|nr:hypothetical protein CCB80_14800 [Armatimonadetes bacterium Uphvl-Ar1]